MLALANGSDITIYLILAFSATGLFLIRFLMMLLGAGHDSDMSMDSGDVSLDHGDVDADHADASPTDHASHHTAHDFRLLSLQSIMAFLMGFGWMGVAVRTQWHLDPFWTFVWAAGFGFLLMLLAAWLAWQVKRFDHVVTTSVRECVGSIGRAYVSIPPDGQGKGQVEVAIGGARRIVAAVSSAATIPAFTRVLIVDVLPDQTLLVAPEPQELQQLRQESPLPSSGGGERVAMYPSPGEGRGLENGSQSIPSALPSPQPPLQGGKGVNNRPTEKGSV